MLARNSAVFALSSEKEVMKLLLERLWMRIHHC